jgi:nanoRNase/pAp phosphatase (c-di-AMP/oligoRNAs hydrolase)
MKIFYHGDADGKCAARLVYKHYLDLGKFLMDCISLRTGKNSDIDVSEIAEKFGGGGHRRAAGFHCLELPLGKTEDDWDGL